MRIKDVKARLVLNSRGEKTIEIEINGYHDSAPSGASKGKYEAKYIDPEIAVKRFNEELREPIKTFDIQSLEDLKSLEEFFFNSGGFERYGANTLIALEFAILKAWSGYTGAKIYEFFRSKPYKEIRLLSNVIGGGAHSRFKGTTFQEFLVIPDTNIKDSIFINAEIHRELGRRLELLDKNFLYSKNDEGAWVTTLNEETVLYLLKETLEDFEERYNVKIDFGIDVAATQFYKDGFYIYKNKTLNRKEQIEYISDLIEEYNIFYIEDPLYEEDFEGFSELNKLTDSLIVGDDLTVTNPERIKKAIKYGSVKGIIIKPNQIGSLIKTIEAVEICKKHNIIPILSHRSGETDSNILTHLAIGLKVPMVKFGIVNERIIKLNEFLRIIE